MTGAGTTSVCWTREPGFLESPVDPTYVHAGRNVSVNDIELSNALERSRLPDDNEAVESIAQNLEGALALEYDLCHPWALTDAFVSEPTGGDPDPLEWTMGRGQMPTSRWFIGVDTGSNTVERVPKAAITTQLQLQVSLNSNVRVTQTLVYADEEKNTSMTPGTIVGGDQSPYVYHGGSFTVDGTTQKKMQSGTIDITNGGSLDQGWNRKAVDAVAGDADYTVNATKIATEETNSNVTLAYGNSNAPALIYAIDYTEEECCDIRVWDTRGENSKHDAEGDLQWRKVFSSGHETASDAQLIFDSGLLRVWLDEAAGTLEAEEWDDANTTWTTVGLGSSQPPTVSLFDVDLMDIAMVRDRAQLTFDVGGSLFALNAILNRGYGAVQFTVPENETGPIPDDLENWLSPIASTSIADPNASKTLVARKEVRK